MQAALQRAKAVLDPLELYPRPVRIDRVRIVIAPWLFRLPLMRHFSGYATWRTILLRQPSDQDDSLIVHELCHVWQMQHHPVRMPLSYLRGYATNAFEAQARGAAGHPPATALSSAATRRRR